MVERSVGMSVLVGVLALASAARAAAPSFECAEAGLTSVQSMICGSTLLSALDAETARLYRLASSPPSGAAVKTEQAAWLKAGDECLGAPAPPICLRDRYLARIAALRAESKRARSADGKGISLGPAAFRCESLDGVLLATFVRTDPPLAYLTRSDQRLTLEQRLSGSGARYGGEGDQLFWEHQGEAMYRERDGGPEVRCRKEGP